MADDSLNTDDFNREPSSSNMIDDLLAAFGVGGSSSPRQASGGSQGESLFDRATTALTAPAHLGDPEIQARIGRGWDKITGSSPDMSPETRALIDKFQTGATDVLTNPWVQTPLALGSFALGMPAGIGVNAGLAALDAVKNNRGGSSGSTPGASLPDSITKGEVIGPKWELTSAALKKDIKGGDISLKKGQTLAPDVANPGKGQKGGAFSSYRQSQEDVNIAPPGAEDAAKKLFLDAKNSVYARYKDAFKGASSNKQAMASLTQLVEKQANEEALGVIPKEYRGVVQGSVGTPDQPAAAPKPDQTGSDWGVAGKIAPLALGALGLFLVKKYRMSPKIAQQVEEAVGGRSSGLATEGAATLQPNTTNVSRPAPTVSATKSDLSSLSSKPQIKQVLGLPGPQGKIPYIPQARAGSGAMDDKIQQILERIRQQRSSGTGPAIALGPSYSDWTKPTGR